MCAHASQMYSRNMEKLLFYITKDGAWKLDFKDEIVAGSRHHARGRDRAPEGRRTRPAGDGVEAGAA